MATRVIKGLNPKKRGNMKNYHITKCVEFIEEIKIFIYKNQTSLVRKDIEDRLNYLKEVFLIQKSQNDSRNKMIWLSKSIGKRKKGNDVKSNSKNETLVMET